MLHPAISWLLVWLQRAISLLEKPLQSGKSNSWRNMGVHSTQSRHVPNPPPSPCKMLISPQSTGATHFSSLHIGNLQLRSYFALNKVKGQKPPWIESILTNGNILNLTSRILPYATGRKCIKISSHFCVLGFKLSVIATILIMQMLYFASMLSAQILLVVFSWLCAISHVQWNFSLYKKIVQCL